MHDRAALQSTERGAELLVERSVADVETPLAKTSSAFRFSAAIATFGMTRRESPDRGAASFALARARPRPAADVSPGAPLSTPPLRFRGERAADSNLARRPVDTAGADRRS